MMLGRFQGFGLLLKSCPGAQFRSLSTSQPSLSSPPPPQSKGRGGKISHLHDATAPSSGAPSAPQRPPPRHKHAAPQHQASQRPPSQKNAAAAQPLEPLPSRPVPSFPSGRIPGAPPASPFTSRFSKPAPPAPAEPSPRAAGRGQRFAELHMMEDFLPNARGGQSGYLQSRFARNAMQYAPQGDSPPVELASLRPAVAGAFEDDPAARDADAEDDEALADGAEDADEDDRDPVESYDMPDSDPEDPEWELLDSDDEDDEKEALDFADDDELRDVRMARAQEVAGYFPEEEQRGLEGEEEGQAVLLQSQEYLRTATMILVGVPRAYRRIAQQTVSKRRRARLRLQEKFAAQRALRVEARDARRALRRAEEAQDAAAGLLTRADASRAQERGDLLRPEVVRYVEERWPEHPYKAQLVEVARAAAFNPRIPRAKKFEMVATAARALDRVKDMPSTMPLHHQWKARQKALAIQDGRNY